jgi:2-amino-4-hydroxy-6-hydroxymethyldihydropteridine diphosphokinase
MLRSIVFLALGSNLGEREENLESAISALQAQGELLAKSRIYETEPVGYEDQPAFLNQVCKVAMKYSPTELLEVTQRIERELGRKPTFPSGPRIIDIDVLFYGERIIHTTNVDIPHPKIPERRFVLVPMCDIAPNLIHPELGKSMRELVDESTDTHWVRPIDGGN